MDSFIQDTKKISGRFSQILSSIFSLRRLLLSVLYLVLACSLIDGGLFFTGNLWKVWPRLAYAQQALCPSGYEQLTEVTGAGVARQWGCINSQTGAVLFVGSQAGANINGIIYVGATYPTIVSALAASPGKGTVVVTQTSPAQTITSAITLVNQRLQIDPGVIVTIGSGGLLDVGSNGILDAPGATLNVTKTTGPALQLSSGWGSVNLGQLTGPGSGTGDGVVFIGGQFNLVSIRAITGFGGRGILFTGVVADGASQNTTDNTVFVQHIFSNGTGILWKNESAPGDFLDENNNVYGGLVNVNANAEIQFGDAGTQFKCQDNAFRGFADSSGSSHAAVVFQNSSYNYFIGQFNTTSHPAFSFITAPNNFVLSPPARLSDLGSGSQSMLFSDNVLGFQNWHVDLEGSVYLIRDNTVSDAWWMRFTPAFSTGGIQLFGGGNQVTTPLLSFNNGGIGFANMLAVRTAPTISSGFGSSASITTNNGTASFTINVGGGSATSGVIGFPAATNGWNVFCEDTSTFSTTVFRTRQIATTTTTATIGNFNSSAVSAPWVAGDILSCMALAR